MNSRVVRAVIIAALLVVALGGCSSLAATGPEHIQKFSVEYTVEASGTVHAVESIDYDFGAAQNKHGIDRFLASRFTNGGGSERIYRYSNVSVTSPSGASALFSTTLSNALQIRIGNKNTTVGGTQSYVISYDIAGALNRPTLDDGTTLDEFYWNVTGNYWTVPISYTSVKVHGPAATTQIACYFGTVGSTNKCTGATPAADGAHFTEGTLNPGEGLTIDLAWPSGTFTNTTPIIEKPLAPGSAITTGSNDGPDPFWSPWNWGSALALLIVIPLTFRLFVHLRRRDKRFVDVTPGMIPSNPSTVATTSAPRRESIVVEYQPPKNFPVGAAGSILNKARKSTDITATLIDLAVRGHLRIEEVDRGKGRAATNFRLVPTPERAQKKEQDARDAGLPAPAALLPHEQQLLASLFGGKENSISLADIRNTFASDMRKIDGALDAWIENGQYFIDKFRAGHPVSNTLVTASVLSFFAMLFLEIPFLFIPVGIFIGTLIMRRSFTKSVRRSALGHALYLQLAGFRLYIATAEADRIRFDEQEDVFSRYMPWAIVFGEAERWAKVFEELAKQGKFTEVPDWYAGSSIPSTGAMAGTLGSVASIGSALTSFSTIAGSAMTSTPSSSGSSGFSSSGGGGGSSGGGGGGGGGGSW